MFIHIKYKQFPIIFNLRSYYIVVSFGFVSYLNQTTVVAFIERFLCLTRRFCGVGLDNKKVLQAPGPWTKNFGCHFCCPVNIQLIISLFRQN